MRWFGFGFGAEAPPAAAPFTGRSFCRSGFSREQPRTRTKFLAKPFRAEAPPAVPFAELQNIPTSLGGSVVSRERRHLANIHTMPPTHSHRLPTHRFSRVGRGYLLTTVTRNRDQGLRDF